MSTSLVVAPPAPPPEPSQDALRRCSSPSWCRRSHQANAPSASLFAAHSASLSVTQPPATRAHSEHSGSAAHNIRPTTAGLFVGSAAQYCNNNNILPGYDQCLAQQQVDIAQPPLQTTRSPLPPLPNTKQPYLLNRREFTRELLDKQSAVERSNAVSPIEDKIRLHKQHQLGLYKAQPPGPPPPPQPFGPGKLSGVGGEIFSPSCHTDRLEMASLPEKLLPMLVRQDKRPFAYSPDVSDPNNRGKLDLTQIKSPAMRRRLIANMESDEAAERQRQLKEQNGDDSDDQDEEDREQLHQHDHHIPHQPHIQHYYHNHQLTCTSIDPSAARARQPISRFAPAKIETFSHRVCPPTTYLQAPFSKPDLSPAVVRHYNEPPIFYHANNSSYCDAIAANSSTINQLDMELAESLDSLSRFVDDFGPSSPPPQSSRSARLGDMSSSRQHSQRLSTFSPPNCAQVRRGTSTHLWPS